MNRCATVLLLTLPAAGAEPTRGAAPPPRMEFSALPLGLQMPRAGAAMPVAVTIANPLPRFEGVLTASIGAEEPLHLWRCPVTLGTGRFRFWLYPQSTRGLSADPVTVRLLDARGRERALREFPLRMREADAIVLAVTAGERRFTGADLPGGRVAVTSLPEQAGLPDRWYGLNAFDAVLWDGARTEPPPRPQREALEAWVRAGGRLILAAKAGDTMLSSPLPGVVAPLRLRDAAPDAACTPRFDADGFPAAPRALFAEQRLGFGRVVLLRADFNALGACPVNEVDALLGLRRAGTGADLGPRGIDIAPARVFRWAASRDRLLLPFVAQLGGFALGSLRPVLVAMLAYILAVSVLDYTVLRRLRRLPWTWLTFPATIALFSLFAYRAFYAGRAGALRRHEVRFLDVAPDATVRSADLACIRNNSNRPIAFTVDGERRLCAFDEQGSFTAAPTYGRAGLGAVAAVSETDSRGGPRAVSLPALVGTYRFFCERAVGRLPRLPLRAALRADGQELDGTIDPPDGQRVEAGFIFHAGGLYVLDRGLRIGRRERPEAALRYIEALQHGAYFGRQAPSAAGAQAAESLARFAQAEPFLEELLERTATDAPRRRPPDGTPSVYSAAGPREAVVCVIYREKDKSGGIPIDRVTCLRQIVAVQAKGDNS